MLINTTDDDARDIAWLARHVIAKEKPRKYGQRIIGALVPRYYKDLKALEYACHISYQTLHSWKQGTSDPRMSQLEPINEVIGFDVIDLLSAKAAHNTVREHPDWPAALAEARRKHGRRLPASAFDAAGLTSGARLPEHIDGEFVAQLADFWWKNATDDEAMNAETDSARREMEQIDRKK